MDDSAPRTLISLDPFVNGFGFYQLPADTFMRPEVVGARISFEGPGIVAATATYADPALGNIQEFATMSTLPSLVQGQGGTHVVTFTFAVTVGPLPTYVPRLENVVAPANSLLDMTAFTAGLPDTVLRQNQIVALTVGGVTTGGLALTFSTDMMAIWAEVVDASTVADVIPPYTSVAYADQTGAVAA